MNGALLQDNVLKKVRDYVIAAYDEFLVRAAGREQEEVAALSLEHVTRVQEYVNGVCLELQPSRDEGSQREPEHANSQVESEKVPEKLIQEDPSSEHHSVTEQEVPAQVVEEEDSPDRSAKVTFLKS